MSQKARAARIRKVLQTIALENKPISIEKAYRESVAMDGVVLRRFSDYLKTLKNAGFIKLTSEGKWLITDAGTKFLRRCLNEV